MKLIGIIATAIISIIGSSIWRGYVLSVLWGWFVVTTFWLPALSIPEAIGLSVVISAFSPTSKDCKEDKESAGVKFGKAVVTAFLGPAFALLAGWIVKHWM